MGVRVLVHIEDPGAANYVAGLSDALVARGHGCALLAEGLGGRALAQRGERLASRDGRSAPDLLAAFRPDVVLVGTSENPDTLAHALVDAARSAGIPSVGVVDAFANASARFRGHSADPLAHAPDAILVPDPWTRDAFVSLGARRVVVCGHPHHDHVRAERARLAAKDRAALRRDLWGPQASDRHWVLFVSEISGGLDAAQFQRSAEYTLHGRGGRDGRTEIVLEELLDGLAEACPDAGLAVRLHPKNTREDLGALLDEVDAVSAGGSALEAAWAADLVVGMSSMLLLEAALLERPTLSVVPRAIERDWLPSTRTGATPCVTERGALRGRLAAWAAGSVPVVPVPVEAGAIDNVIRVIERVGEGRTA
jgi:hypothetical protein